MCISMPRQRPVLELTESRGHARQGVMVREWRQKENNMREQPSIDKQLSYLLSAFRLVAPFGKCSRVAGAMTCLRAWRSEVPREIWRFELLVHQANNMSGSLTALHERCSTWVKCGCTLSSKVAPRGRKVVGLRRTCAGLSCLTLDVFVAYRGASASTGELLCVLLLQYQVYNACSLDQHTSSRPRRWRCRVRPL